MKPNTNPEQFKKGYGEKAYEHAKPIPSDNRENWLRKNKAMNDLRLQEYEKRLTKLQKRAEKKEELALQPREKITHVGDKFVFRKGDTLYPALTKDFWGMNEHTAFFAMVKMLKSGINVDLWHPGDEITFCKDGSLKVKRSGKEQTIPWFLQTTNESLLAAAEVEPDKEEETPEEVNQYAVLGMKLKRTIDKRLFVVSPMDTGTIYRNTDTVATYKNQNGEKVEAGSNSVIVGIDIPESKIPDLNLANNAPITSCYFLYDMANPPSDTDIKRLVDQTVAWARGEGSPAATRAPGAILFRVSGEFVEANSYKDKDVKDLDIPKVEFVYGKGFIENFDSQKEEVELYLSGRFGAEYVSLDAVSKRTLGILFFSLSEQEKHKDRMWENFSDWVEGRNHFLDGLGIDSAGRFFYQTEDGKDKYSAFLTPVGIGINLSVGDKTQVVQESVGQGDRKRFDARIRNILEGK